MINVQETLILLEDLENLGFSDDAFWRLHHKREPTAVRAEPLRETIKNFRRYCEQLKTDAFEFDGENERVHKRLAFVLKIYRGIGFAKNQSNVFVALAEASFEVIPTKQRRTMEKA